MKKIIIVNSSPRAKGNCAKAVEILQENITDAEIEVFNLREKTVKPCMACGACKAKDTAMCVQKDDMGALLADIDSCDALVVATPIYYGTVNGPAKTFLDRTYPFFNPAKDNMSNATKFGKKVAIILTAGSMPRDVNLKQGEAYNCFDVAGFTESKVLSFNSEISGMDANIFSIEDDANQIKDLAKWLSE